jgi:hypothetical protein
MRFRVDGATGNLWIHNDAVTEFGGYEYLWPLAGAATGDVLTATVAGSAVTLSWDAPGAVAHNLFSATHADTTGAASPVDGDIIIGNVTPKWAKLAITVPAAGLINHLAVANGETRPSWKALFDATVPTTIAPSDAAAAGVAVVAARRDHVHGAPATWPATAHNVLSTTHGDTLADTVIAGDVMIGNATPKWSRLAIAVPAANVRNVLGIDNAEALPSWKTALDATAPTTIAPSAAAAAGTSLVFSHRDHTHGAPATFPATAHDILSASHGDTLGAAVADGSIIIGNVTPKWSALAISVPAAGLINHLAIANGETRPSWKALFDATAPTTIAESAAAAAGVAVVAARRDHVHGAPATWTATAHAVLSTTHSDTLAAAVADGSIIIGNATPKWSTLAIAVPAANVRNVLGVDNGETRPSWKTALDATAPTTIAAGAAAAAGTSLVFAHRDHTHGAPATWAATAHDIFSAIHGDTTGAAAVVDGDIIIGNATPKWSKLARSVPAANVRNVLGIDNAETRPSWKTALDGTNPATLTAAAAAAPGTSLVFAHRDHVHPITTTVVGAASTILATDASGYTRATRWQVGDANSYVYKIAGQAGIFTDQTYVVMSGPAGALIWGNGGLFGSGVAGDLGDTGAARWGAVNATTGNYSSDVTITGKLVVGSSGSAFGNGDICAARSATTGVLYFGGGQSVFIYYDATDITFYGAGGASPFSNNVMTSGGSARRWSNVYSVLGNYSGQVTLSVAAGTAPLAVTSTTRCDNLNADYLDNYHAATASTANTVALRNASGDLDMVQCHCDSFLFDGTISAKISGVYSHNIYTGVGTYYFMVTNKA